MAVYCLAIDIGASGGRHILGHRDGGSGEVILEEVHRFPNNPVKTAGGILWDVDRLYAEIITGIKKCAALGKIPASLAIDTWAVDYALVSRDGLLVPPVYSYRDTARTADYLDVGCSAEEYYGKAGIPPHPFNTVFQLRADAAAGRLKKGVSFFMLPEYFSARLTGTLGTPVAAEYTNASTTGLLDARKRDWNRPLIESLGFDAALFPPVRLPPYSLGTFSPAVASETLFSAEVLMVGSHDTASAVSVVGNEDLYISSGTWSLLGTHIPAPITTAAARNSLYANEGAVTGDIRFLKNIMGLWMLQGIRQEADGAQGLPSFADIEKEGRKVAAAGKVWNIDVNAEVFVNPESMGEAVKNACAASGQNVPASLGELACAVYQSLAAGYAKAVSDLEAITGVTYPEIRIIGGGSKDAFLNELTSKAAGKPVKAGPAEATATGNLLLQLKYIEGR